ncbi:MAG: hypothetical protein KGK01_16140 [Bradyrhizobium sp.]|nr:hypothetical protein [Pseudomonadota bacterium]MDE2243896.1 hypothetical protein [Bradyrhizobium sp.]
MSNISKRASTLAALTAALTFTAAMPAFAQAPTDAQRSAIRSACRSDYMAHCSSVPPGGMESLQCLQKNMSSLSSGCQSAVRAVEPAAEPKAEAKPEAEPEAKPEPKAEPKSEPAPAATAAPAEEPVAETAAPVTKSTESPAAGTPKKPSSAQAAAIRSACRSDYMAHCSSIPPGGAASLKCLKQNETHLSANCRQAVNAVGGGSAGPAAGSAPAAATASPGAAPAAAPMMLRPMRPREVMFVLRSACGADVRALCGGVPAGGGRIVQCLAGQAASLSPACRDVLGSFAR